jgi:hypothetical protein
MTDGLVALVRHFADLRDGTHGGVGPRAAKQVLFARAVDLLDTPVREVLDAIDRVLLLGTGAIAATGLTVTHDGDVTAIWTLSWPAQRSAGVQPIAVQAVYGRGFHHPHLSGGTVGD